MGNWQIQNVSLGQKLNTRNRQKFTAKDEKLSMFVLILDLDAIR